MSEKERCGCNYAINGWCVHGWYDKAVELEVEVERLKKQVNGKDWELHLEFGCGEPFNPTYPGVIPSAGGE